MQVQVALFVEFKRKGLEEFGISLLHFAPHILDLRLQRRRAISKTVFTIRNKYFDANNFFIAFRLYYCQCELGQLVLRHARGCSWKNVPRFSHFSFRKSSLLWLALCSLRFSRCFVLGKPCNMIFYLFVVFRRNLKVRCGVDCSKL